MALKRLPYRSLGLLIRDRLSTDEEQLTTQLIKELRPARRRGYLTKSELEKICRWKSARAIRHIQSNSAATIRSATKHALATAHEMRKVEILRTLSGVSLPMASAILTLLNPKEYGVIDIRVWQVLYKMKSVHERPAGVNFTSKHWYRYLMLLRYHARTNRVSTRDIERTLFLTSKHYQVGRLYK